MSDGAGDGPRYPGGSSTVNSLLFLSELWTRYQPETLSLHLVNVDMTF